MDTNALHTCFNATLQADPNSRMEAELQLKAIASSPGLISGCLDIVMEPQVSDAVKIAAVVYLKNKIERDWNPLHPVSAPISDQERAIFRERLIPALVEAPPNCRLLLSKALNYIVARDFPSQWPEFLSLTLVLFQNGDTDSTRAGLTCLLEICKHYRWTTGDTRKGLDEVVSSSFAGILNIGISLVNETSTTAAEMLRDLLKIYKCATFQELPKGLQEPKILAAWGNLMLSIIRKDLPDETLKEPEDSRNSKPWVKCKKWAFANLYRLFYRYASPRKTTHSKSSQYAEFAQEFISNYVPEILNVYFDQIEQWVNKKIWLGTASLYNILAFLEECINYKETWAFLTPHTDIIISHVVFPLLCTSDSDIEIFETDPEEYIHKNLDVYEEDPTPDTAATNFLVTLIRKRSKVALPNLLQFVQSIVASHVQSPEDLSLARQQEGALRIMGSISHLVLTKNSPIARNMEAFIAQYVFPDFSSPHGFLRSRACQLLNLYAEVNFEKIDNVSFAYQSILRLLDDEYLPVQIEAALCLQPLIRNKDVDAAISDRVPEVMTRLLDLANRIDIDSITSVIEEFVESFSQQLTPFAVDLARKLTDQLMRLLNELDEQQNSDFDISNYDGNAHEDKTMTAVGVLNTISTLLLALDNASIVVLELEVILKPVISTVLDKRMSDFYAEVFGLIDNSTYCLKAISPTMWSLLPVIHTVFKDDAVEYLSELSPCLENYLQYGTRELSENPELAAIFYEVFQVVLGEDDRPSDEDRSIACSIGQRFLLSLKGHIDLYVPLMLKTIISRLIKDYSSKTRDVPYIVNTLEVILAALCYNAQATLSVLEAESFTQQFFNLWFDNMDQFTRVYDIKLVILSMLSLFVLNDNELPAAINSSLGQISKGLVCVVDRLPQAMKHRENLDRNFDATDDYEKDDLYNEWNNDEDDDDDDVDDQAEEEETHSNTKEFLNYLDTETSGFQGSLTSRFYGPPHGLEEEALTESILDAVNPLRAIKDTFMRLQESNSDRYMVLTGNYTKEEINIIDNAMSSC